MTKLKRRDALKSLGTISLGFAATSVSKAEKLAEPYSVKNKALETEILVVGGGTAGTIAAIQAGRAGCSAILIECGSQLGGYHHHGWGIISWNISRLGKTNNWWDWLGACNGLCEVEWGQITQFLYGAR